MKRLVLFCLLLLSGITCLNAQEIDDNSVLLIVGSDTTTRGEFYKNYTQNAVRGRDIESKAELENYLQLYINFRLKVDAAKDAGYDTIRLLQ